MLVPPETVPERQGTLCALSNVKRDGAWMLPRLFRAVSIMGEVKLDLRDVRLGAGVSEIQVCAVLGNIRIIAPHNLRVEVEGTRVLGEFKVRRTSKSLPSPEAPIVRITGGSYLGSVIVRIVDPEAPTALDRVRAWVNGEVKGG
jgi:hypothetical protein